MSKQSLTKKGLITMLTVGIIGVIILSFVVGIGLDYAHVAWNVDAYSKEVDISKKEINQNEIVVMSFNIRCWTGELFGKHRWGLRAPLVFETIGNSMPDILGVQELQKRPDKHLAKYLVGYGRYTPYRASKGINSESCGIYYNEKRFTLLDKGVFWLSKTPEKESIGWDAALPRICSWVKLEDKNGKELFVFNCHLDHAGEEARMESLKLIKQKIEVFEATNVILLGDLNFPENVKVTDANDPYNYVTSFLDDSKYADGVNVVKKGNTFHGYGKKGIDEPYVIDFILFKSEDLKAKTYGIVDAKINGEYISDHNPVQVVFEYK
ncbi:MAG: endonuclease/exonuclease/phosphatase family protein [Christensenellales bacterium]|nr:endonuclease/exonuclease/phosphatase family protein [Clostridiales bacterium]